MLLSAGFAALLIVVVVVYYLVPRRARCPECGSPREEGPLCPSCGWVFDDGDDDGEDEDGGEPEVIDAWEDR